jgi:hypothetical protein
MQPVTYDFDVITDTPAPQRRQPQPAERAPQPDAQEERRRAALAENSLAEKSLAEESQRVKPQAAE